MSLNKDWLVLVEDTVHLFTLFLRDDGITCTILTQKSSSLCGQPSA